MASNKTGADKIHKRMPAVYKTKENPNWSAVIGAMGESDSKLLDLIQEVRKQFTVSTASRPYIDRLGANFKVSRPKFVGMDDATFRRFVPIVAYQPKQVKLVMDLLLDLFFFKEATTSFTQSSASQLFNIKDGWGLEYIVDGGIEERIIFNDTEFVDNTNITANELVSSINRQAENSFAIVFDDRLLKRQFVRLFSNTVGSKGSIEITGGLANIGLRFSGFIDSSGSGSNTQWNIVKTGNTVVFTHTGGITPNLQNLEAGNIALIDIPGNEGTFIIDSVDIGADSFTVTNLFGTTMTYDHSSDPTTSVRFMAQEKVVIFKNNTRAIVWEVSPGEIIVEMPASPPVVRRSLIGSAHINGLTSLITDVPSDSTLTLEDGNIWPIAGGKFVIQELKEIQTHIETSSEDLVLTKQFNTRYNNANEFEYTGRSGNNIFGITPEIPTVSQLFESTIVTAIRDTASLVTVTTSTDHGFNVGESVGVLNSASSIITQGVTVDILTTDTTIQIAMKTAAILNTIPFFTVSSLGSVTTVTDNNFIDVIDAVDVNTGATVTVTQQGVSGVLPEITDIDFATTSAAALDVVGVGNHFTLNTDGNDIRYHVWFRVTDGNVQIDPAVSPPVNGSHIIKSVLTPTSFTYVQTGTTGTSFGGIAKVERYGMANSGSFAHLSSARTSTGILGPHMWDGNATFVLSSLTSNIQQKIFAGTLVKQLLIDIPNNVPDDEGFVIFDFGTELEEGPVRYLFKPTDGALQLDPAYVFKNNHEIGSSITVIRRRGAHVLSGLGLEYPAYVTDPAVARVVLQDLLLEVKSVGIFIEFLVRFPEQLYATLDVYKSCRDGLYPLDEVEAAKCE